MKRFAVETTADGHTSMVRDVDDTVAKWDSIAPAQILAALIERGTGEAVRARVVTIRDHAAAPRCWARNVHAIERAAKRSATWGMQV